MHLISVLETGGNLQGRPRYNQSRCFQTFPIPTATEVQESHIRALAEHIDTHRKRQQATHPGLTPTAMYNVLEKLRDGETLSANERTIHEQGLVSVLRQLHDELDLAVLDAYTLERSRASAAGRAGQCDALVIELSGRRRGR